MLAFLDNSIWTHWDGQSRPLHGAGSYQLPRAAEAIYSDEELAAYGLVRVTPADIPEGKRIVSSSLRDQAGKPVEVAVVEDLPPPTDAEVNDERIRRIGMPLVVTVTGVGSFPIDMTEQSRANITGLTVLALPRLAQGDTSVMTTFRDADNADHDLTPAQAIEIGVQATAEVDRLYKASWALKDAEGGIPRDFADDGYWVPQ